MKLILVIVLLLSTSCAADVTQQPRGTNPPSLAIAPPWMYSKTPRVRTYPATRPNRPVVITEQEKPAAVPQRQRSAPREESSAEPVDEQVDDLLNRIEWLRQELKRK